MTLRSDFDHIVLPVGLIIGSEDTDLLTEKVIYLSMAKFQSCGETQLSKKDFAGRIPSLLSDESLFQVARQMEISKAKYISSGEDILSLVLGPIPESITIYTKVAFSKETEALSYDFSQTIETMLLCGKVSKESE